MSNIKQAMLAAIDNNWKEIDKTFPYKSSMESCIQDPIHHAEGDVWTHTSMVYDNVISRNLSDSHKICALYHDVAKPQTRTEDARADRVHISHPNHSRLGAQILWRDLWKYDLGDLDLKLKSYWMVRWHQRIFHTWTQDDMIKSALGCHVDIDISELINFAICDSFGRYCNNQEDTINELELLNEWVLETKLKSLLSNNYSRLFFFEKDDRSPYYDPMPPAGSDAVLMCGLPGSGKDTLVSKKYKDYTIISLDDIRLEMNIHHGDNQGTVIQSALEKTKVCLRNKAPLVWNATNLTKQMRGKVIKLLRDYDAKITIECTATPLNECLFRNSKRKDPVPESAIMHMLDKWEPPSLTEAHIINWNIT